VVRDLGEFAVQDLRPCAYRTEQTVHFARNRPERRNVHGSMILPPNQNYGRDCCHGGWRIVRSAAAGMRLLRRYANSTLTEQLSRRLTAD